MFLPYHLITVILVLERRVNGNELTLLDLFPTDCAFLVVVDAMPTMMSRYEVPVEMAACSDDGLLGGVGADVAAELTMKWVLLS